MILNINHMSFTVSDVERSVLFYRDVLGLELLDICGRDREFSESVTGVLGAQLKIAYLKAPNCCVELVQYLTPEGIKIDTKTCNVGSSHICFYVDKFEEMIKVLKANHIVFAGKSSVIPAGPNKGRSVVYIEDPDSNTIEFISQD